jgi:type II secretory pathway predicted ATPase ExeA
MLEIVTSYRADTGNLACLRAWIETPAQGRALDRLIHAIEGGEPQVWLRGEPGVGKSVVLERLRERLDATRWRVASAVWNGESHDLFSSLADSLAGPPSTRAAASSAQARLRDAVRVRQWEGSRVLLAIDAHDHSIDGGTLARIRHLGLDGPGRLAVLAVERSGRERRGEFDEESSFVVNLDPLTRSEAARYLEERMLGLGSVGRRIRGDAATLLHALARGVPRRLDRLAMHAVQEADRAGCSTIEPQHVELAESRLAGLPA